MDITCITTNTEGKVMDVLHPVTQEKLGLRLKVISPYSTEFAKVMQQAFSETDAGVGDIKKAASYYILDLLDYWEFDGRKLEATKDDINIILEHWPWLGVQVTNFVNDAANFISAS